MKRWRLVLLLLLLLLGCTTRRHRLRTRRPAPSVAMVTSAPGAPQHHLHLVLLGGVR